MSKSLRALLLVTTSLLIVGCDDKSTEDTAAASVDQTQNIVGIYAPQNIQPIRKTLSGSYLAGQHAQLTGDWKTAGEYFEDLLKYSPDDTNIQSRLMALSLGSGDYDRAVLLAENILETRKDDSLAQLITILQVKQDGLGSAIMPLVQAWCEAGLGKSKTDTLKDSPSFLYQAVLIADYNKDKEAVAKLAKTYNFTRTPTPISGLEDVADVFAKYGETTEAKDIYTSLRKALPDSAGRLNEKIKKLSEQQPIETETITPQEGLARALLDTARLLSNGYEESAILFTHMSRFLDPHKPDTLELLAQFSADNKQFESAITYLTKIQNDGDKATQISITRQIALLLELDNKTDEAIRILKTLVETDNNVEAQIQIGDIYRQNENYKDALSAYNKAVDMLGKEVPQEKWQLLFSRGIANERMKNWDQAEEDLLKALSYEPDQPYILNYLGYTWADHGQNLDKAAEMIEKAALLKPDDGAIIDSLGWVYYRIGKFSEAVVTLEKAVELQPYESEINDHLGDAYWQVGRKNEARFQWRRAISFTKDSEIISKIETKITNGLPTSDLAKSSANESTQSNTLVKND